MQNFTDEIETEYIEIRCAPFLLMYGKFFLRFQYRIFIARS